MNLTKNLRKYVKSLHLSKYRQKYNKFIAEGPKICAEFLKSEKYKIEYLMCTQQWVDDNTDIADSYDTRLVICNDKDLKSISTLQNSNNILIVMDKIDTRLDIYPILDNSVWTILLDKLQDPGNMGTILRIADWYGVESVIASMDSVDYYNPKVVQSAMGAHNRIIMAKSTMSEIELEKYNCLAMVIDGVDINAHQQTTGSGIIVIGNESKGISEKIMAQCRTRLSITKKGGAESLNAAVACGIACHQLID